jgi:hypothetical protein
LWTLQSPSSPGTRVTEWLRYLLLMSHRLILDNGKVFTGRFGPGRGEVLFDRIVRENGIRHLLTAPRSPTTTGKVERFHKTVRAEFLRDRIFASLAEAQGELDAWVARYNTRRPHQGIGMVPPARRFALAVPEVQEDPADPAPPRKEIQPVGPPARTVTRLVGQDGSISLATFSYPVGRWLAGETVEVLLRDDALLEVFHGGVLVCAHACRHPKEKEPKIRTQRVRRVPRVMQGLVRVPVIRKVDPRGDVAFAGTSYRVGMSHVGQDVEVHLVNDTVQIYFEGTLIRTHEARHDKSKEHGAFGVPRGRPRKKKAS